MIDKKELKEVVDFAYSEMPEDSMNRKEAKRQKNIIFKKIDSEKITTIDEVLTEFNRMM